MPTRGVVYVHSSPLAVCQHVEWAIGRALNSTGQVPVSLQWTGQPAESGARRAECGWSGRPGAAADIARELKQWPMIRFEVTEEPSPGCDGERFMYVPGRGLFRAAMGAAGDIQIGEDRLRALIAAARTPETLTHELDAALGTPWDAELEPFRYAAAALPTSTRAAYALTLPR